MRALSRVLWPDDEERVAQSSSARQHQLYERLLGASFERLPAPLQRFHARPGGTAEFTMEVTYEPGLLRTVLSALLRLPAPSARAPGKLVVTVRDDREVWERIFPDTKLRTVHWIDGDHLVEESGPLQFVFDVDVSERGLRFSSIACRFLGRTLPHWLVPRIEAAARADERGWNLLVSIAVPVLGRLATYGGPVTPLP
jgi:hypothetical protein